jgi:hypothetical protein
VAVNYFEFLTKRQPGAILGHFSMHIAATEMCILIVLGHRDGYLIVVPILKVISILR